MATALTILPFCPWECRCNSFTVKIRSIDQIGASGRPGRCTVLWRVSCVALIKHNGDPLWFVWIGDRFNAGDPQGNLGYDGQFVYYIAQDGWDSAEKLDIPAYRLQRILYPVVARVVSLNSPDVLPWAMLAVNFVAITATTGALAVWLQRNNCSPWYALGYGLYLGTFMAYSRDVTEPLAFGLTAIGVILWLDDKLWPALVLFALGGLAKEQALLLPIGLGIAALLARNWRQVALLPLSAVPLLIWDVVLWLRFDTIPVGSGSSVQLIPLQGIVSQLTGNSAEYPASSLSPCLPCC